MGTRIGIVIAQLVLIGVLAAGDALAAAPRTINHQGNLAGAGGAPVTATVTMVFSLYGAASGGTPLWSETRR